MAQIRPLARYSLCLHVLAIRVWPHSDEAVNTTPQQAIEQARNEYTIEYDTTAVAYDSEADIWRVTFYTEGSAGNSQDVYLNGNGLTALIIYGE